MTVPIAQPPDSGRRGPGRPPEDPASARGQLAALIRGLRTSQGLTLARLSVLTGYSVQHLGAVERGQVVPSEAVVSACEDVLAAGGQLAALFPGVIREQARTRHAREAARHGARTLPAIGTEWPQLAFAARRPSTVSGTLVEDLEQITDRHRLLYHELSSGEMLGPVEAHLSLLASLMRGSQPDPLRHRIASAAAEAAGLAAWLWLDLGDQVKAMMLYEMADGLLGQSGNPALCGYVTGYRVLAADATGARGQAVCHAETARRQTPATASRMMRSWLAAISASASALAGDKRGALGLIGQARDLLETASGREEWMYDFDPSSLAVYQGQCHLRIGQPGAAMSAVEAGLASLPDGCERRKAGLMAQLAEACLPAGKPETAMAYARQALDIYARRGSAAGLHQIGAICLLGQTAGYQRHARELKLHLDEYVPDSK